MRCIYTGEISTGKSTMLKKFIQNSNNRNLWGWISPPYYNSKAEKTGHDFQLIRRGTCSHRIPITRNTSFNKGFSFGKYYFSEIPFNQTRSFITEIPNDATIIIDEIGPLEIKLNKGFSDTFEEILAKSENILITVRAECIELFINKYPQYSWRTIKHNEDITYEQIQQSIYSN